MNEQDAAGRSERTPELKVFISTRDSTCDECGEELGRHAWITLVGEESKAFCLSCADLDHLVFLPPGDAALTRRARKHSTLAAVVLKWSRARKRYERQGLLVEEQALQTAETECLADAEARQRRREREAERRSELDAAFVARFAQEIQKAYPGCPPHRAEEIAVHACRKYSDRVGRSAAAKRFDPQSIELAVLAHLRHTETRYDDLLARGVPRHEARQRTRDAVDRALERWRHQAEPRA